MRVPLTIADQIERAELIYPDRVGIVDEPDGATPGACQESLGTLTYRRIAELARAQAAALDERGIGEGERVAVVSQNSARLFISFFGVSAFGRVLVPINFRLNHDEISYIVDHCGASMLLYDPELEDTINGIECKHKLRLGAATDERALPRGPRAAAVGEPRPRTPPAPSTTRAARRHGRRACS